MAPQDGFRHGNRLLDAKKNLAVRQMAVERCIAEGLVGGEGFAVDASLIRAVSEYLEVLDDAAFGGATPVTPKRIAITYR